MKESEKAVNRRTQVFKRTDTDCVQEKLYYENFKFSLKIMHYQYINSEIISTKSDSSV